MLMEVPVHNMGTMLPAPAQWDILEICVEVHIHVYIFTYIYMYACVYIRVYECMSPEHFPVVFPEIVPKECEENKCLNGGSCTQYGDGYRCSCSAGFTGDTCEIKGIYFIYMCTLHHLNGAKLL